MVEYLQYQQYRHDEDDKDKGNVTFEKYIQTWLKGVPQVCDDYCRKQEACLLNCGFISSVCESCVNDGDLCSLSTTSLVDPPSPSPSPALESESAAGSTTIGSIDVWHGSIIMLTSVLLFSIITMSF